MSSQHSQCISPLLFLLLSLHEVIGHYSVLQFGQAVQACSVYIMLCSVLVPARGFLVSPR